MELINDYAVLDLISGSKRVKEAIPNYAIAPLEAGAKIHVDFGKQRHAYLIVSKMHVPLFCANDYYGALFIIPDGKKMRKRFAMIRGDAVVFSSKTASIPIHVIGNTGDIIWDEVLENPGKLQRHFTELYWLLRETQPDFLEEQIENVLRFQFKPRITEDGNFTF